MTIFVATVRSSLSYRSETRSTLQYASFAVKITSEGKNQLTDDDQQAPAPEAAPPTKPWVYISWQRGSLQPSLILDLTKSLETKRVSVWSGPSDAPLSERFEAVANSLLCVLLVTPDYAEVSGDEESSYSEYQWINHNKKPCVVVKMCANYDASKFHEKAPIEWLPNSNGEFGNPPYSLVEKIVRQYVNEKHIRPLSMPPPPLPPRTRKQK